METLPLDHAKSALPAGAPGTGVPTLGGRVPSLDGLRALSILLVIIGHVRTTTSVPYHVRRWATAVPGNASLGVSIFFVISGFLITHLLLREKQKTGRISLSGFYLRRFFRIMPAYYTFLLCLIVLRHFGLFFVWNHNLAAAGLFLTDYSPWPTDEPVGHTWSLSVEEQFYLFWPLLLSLVGRERGKRAALLLILLAPAVRAACFLLLPHHWLFVRRIPFLLHTRVDSLMFGCFAALCYPAPWFQQALRKVYDARLHWAAFAFLFLVSPYLVIWNGSLRAVGIPLRLHWNGDAYLNVAAYSIEGVCTVLLLVWAVQNVSTPFGRLLNWRPVVHVGLISYSLYLWQQLFLVRGEGPAPVNPTWTGRFPVNLLCAVAAAEFSYFVIERTFLRWRDRLVGGHRYEKPVSIPLAAPGPDAAGQPAAVQRQSA